MLTIDTIANWLDHKWKDQFSCFFPESGRVSFWDSEETLPFLYETENHLIKSKFKIDANNGTSSLLHPS